MKTGITMGLGANGYDRWGDECYKKMKEHGYSYVDFGMAETDSLIYTLDREESDAFLLRHKALAEAAGIGISQVHGPWRWPPRDLTDEDRAERMEKMKKSIRAASILGTKNWVIHPIMPFGIEDIGTGNEKKTWDMNIEFMSELLKTAKEYDITICFENMPMLKFSLAKPADIVRFINTIDDEHFKMCLDTGHVGTFEDLSIGDAVRLAGDNLQVLHVHDTRRGMDLHMMPYFGVINWEEFTAALKEIGFKGVLSLETSPSVKLDNDIFEDMCRALGKLAGRIAAAV